MGKILISFVAIAVLIITPIIGIFFGIWLAKIHLLRQQRKLEKNAIEVIEGKRKNILKIDGVEYDATKFKVRNNDGKEVVIEFGSGKKEKQEEAEVIKEEKPKKKPKKKNATNKRKNKKTN